MKLYLKQKVFAWNDRFFVKDENGSDRFSVEGEIFSLGKRLHIYDANGIEIALIRQKLIAWLPRYFVEIDGKVMCEIVKEFTFLNHSYRLEGLPWRLNGDFMAHDYSLENNGKQIMRMYKEWFTWGDSYVLDIDDNLNPIEEFTCLCVALAVDCAMARNN